MGNSPSSMGDMFYPDNPNRRARAAELRSQILAFGDEFNAIKTRRDDTVNRIRTKVDQLLQERRFSSSQDLMFKVKGTLNPEELAKYQQLASTLKTFDQTEGIVFDLIGLAGAAYGVIPGVGFIAGIVTAEAALATMSVVAGIMTTVRADITLNTSGPVEGYMERGLDQTEINSFFTKRVQMKLYLEQMRAIFNWVTAVDAWLNPHNPRISDPTMLNKLLTTTLEVPYLAWTPQYLYSVLHQSDIQNGSWTNEDPTPTYSLPPVPGFVAEKVSKPAALVPTAVEAPKGRGAQLPQHLDLETTTTTPQQGSPHQVTSTEPPAPIATFALKSTTDAEEHIVDFVYKKGLTKDSCLALDGDNVWKITGKPTDLKNIRLETVKFDFEPVPEDSEKRGAKGVLKKVKFGDCAVRVLKNSHR